MSRIRAAKWFGRWPFYRRRTLENRRWWLRMNNRDKDRQKDSELGDPEPGDPALGDESDPEYEFEMFRTYRAMGWTPDVFPNRDYADRYAAWLKTERADD
jgi:hypothetical protein